MTRIENEWRYFDEHLNMPYPWYTSPCLQWLEKLDLRGKWVFEYGAGDSTKWYAKRGANALGVDYDERYAREGFVKHYTQKYSYVNSIWGMNKPGYIRNYDIIVIDGEWRDDCTEQALKHLMDGYLIIDNYKQPSVPCDWTKTEALIKDMEVMEFKEPGHPDWCSIVVKKP